VQGPEFYIILKKFLEYTDKIFELYNKIKVEKPTRHSQPQYTKVKTIDPDSPLHHSEEGS
jgi:hypothetical protein